MELKLKKLKIQNFKGIKSFELNIQSDMTLIKGENGVGKTTMFDAFTFLLFGKDSAWMSPEGTNGFELKPRKGGVPIHGLEHVVEGTVEVDGKIVVLRRVFKEKWTKPKGQVDKVLSGHETDFYVDEVPKTETEYKAFLGTLIDEDRFKLITDPMYFNVKLDWQKRREIMMAIAKELSPDEVFDKHPEIASVRDIIVEKGPDEALKMFKWQRKMLNDDIAAIPARIDEVNRALPVLAADYDESKYVGLKESLNQKRAAITEKIADAQKIASEKKAAIYEKISIVMKEINAVKAHNREQNEKFEHAKRERAVAQTNKLIYQDSVADIESRISALGSEQKSLLADQASHRAEWEKLQAAFDEQIEVDTSCPLCNQELPSDQRTVKRQQAVENYRAGILKQIEAVKQKGIKTKDDISRLDKRIIDLERHLALEKEKLIKAAEKEQEISDIQCEPVDDESTSELEAKLSQMQEEAGKPLAADTTSLNESLKLIDEEILECTKAMAATEQIEKAQIRIDELKDVEKTKGAEIVKLDGKILNTEKYIALYAEMQEGSLNGMFESVTFRLFDRQVNGGITPTFTTLINGVAFSKGVNDAAKINGGLEILDKLQQHYQFSAPVFVDHAESVTKVRPISGQMIQLVVSEDHPSLYVEAR